MRRNVALWFVWRFNIENANSSFQYPDINTTDCKINRFGIKFFWNLMKIVQLIQRIARTQGMSWKLCFYRFLEVHVVRDYSKISEMVHEGKYSKYTSFDIAASRHAKDLLIIWLWFSYLDFTVCTLINTRPRPCYACNQHREVSKRREKCQVLAITYVFMRLPINLVTT